jgi:hypothetical protein
MFLGEFFPTGNPREMGEIIGKMCDLLEPLKQIQVLVDNIGDP